MRYLSSFFLLLFCSGLAFAQEKPTIYDRPMSDRRVSYDMKVSLDPETKTIAGRQRVQWRNPDSVPVDTLQFHLYLNAFKDNNSTFMRESGGVHRGFTASGEDPWGGVQINSMRVVNIDQQLPGELGGIGLDDISTGQDITERIEFIQPDDGNTQDQTVIAVALPRAVLPGETITLDIDFDSKLPKISARTGWEESSGDSLFYMVAQWFPKLGVYEIPGQRYVPEIASRGQWSTHQFHQNSEFYADYGTYRVEIETPIGYTVGATGVEVSRENRDGKTISIYWADDVHDFAWTASADYLESFQQWQHVKIRLLLQPEHEAQADRHYESAINALEWFGKNVGEYPYSTLTIIDGIGGSNGMEYPTLITAGTVYKLPKWARSLEQVTIHEFGHQYWYGLLASNEAEESWLDEGINSYTELKIMDSSYGDASFVDLPGLTLNVSQFQRLIYTKMDPGRGAIYTRSWEHTGDMDYGKTSYMKPATMLMTLEGLIGEEQMMELLKAYYDIWRFRHPTTNDFMDVAEEVTGQELDWFFSQFIFGTVTVDYEVQSLSNTRQEDDETFDTKIQLHRIGDGYMPQTIRLTYADESTKDFPWDGEDEWYELNVSQDQRVVQAELDPEFKIKMDINRLNNRRTRNYDTNLASRKYSNKVLVWVQQLLFAIGALV